MPLDVLGLPMELRILSKLDDSYVVT